MGQKTKVDNTKPPKWVVDEVLFAVNTYFHIKNKKINDKTIEVLQLSANLNILPIYAKKIRTRKFRNINGMVLTLLNIANLDKNTSIKYGTNTILQKKVWDAFYNMQPYLDKLCNTILLLLPNIKRLKIDNKFNIHGNLMFSLHQRIDKEGFLINNACICEMCGKETHSKNILHYYKDYVAYGDKYDPNAYMSLCNDCHDKIHDKSYELSKYIYKSKTKNITVQNGRDVIKLFDMSKDEYLKYIQKIVKIDDINKRIVNDKIETKEIINSESDILIRKNNMYQNNFSYIKFPELRDVVDKKYELILNARTTVMSIYFDTKYLYFLEVCYKSNIELMRELVDFDFANLYIYAGKYNLSARRVRFIINIFINWVENLNEIQYIDCVNQEISNLFWEEER